MSPEIICNGNQHGLRPTAGANAGLEWLQDESFIQESLDLHPLSSTNLAGMVDSIQGNSGQGLPSPIIVF